MNEIKMKKKYKYLFFFALFIIGILLCIFIYTFIQLKVKENILEITNQNIEKQNKLIDNFISMLEQLRIQPVRN
jgi:dipeptide/tripeptide permease